LTHITPFRNIASVTLHNTPQLKALRKRLARATSVRGKKAELARKLRVPMPRVAEWLNGSVAPGGEITLQLLEWVSAEEAKQQKSPRRVQAQRERKTR